MANQERSQTPWEALIAQMAMPAPAYWCERRFSVNAKFDDESLVNWVLSDRRMVPSTARDRKAARAWVMGDQEVNVVGLRTLSDVLSRMSCAPVRMRRIGEAVTTGDYLAPPATDLANLLFRAERAIAHHPALLRSLLRGLVLIAIHPFLDGNGRGARMFWVSGLLKAGLDPQKISQAFSVFYGADRRASRIFTSCACSGGTSEPFVRRWHGILANLDSG